MTSQPILKLIVPDPCGAFYIALDPISQHRLSSHRSSTEMMPEHYIRPEQAGGTHFCFSLCVCVLLLEFKSMYFKDEGDRAFQSSRETHVLDLCNPDPKGTNHLTTPSRF